MKYIKKEKLRVVVYTEQYRIVGNIYFVPGTRLTDTLNVKVKDFIPLTEVVVMDNKENAVLVEVPYLAVYRDSILFVHPLEPDLQKEQAFNEESIIEKSDE
ncbi:MAG: hypothetical protein N2440_00735 [Actinobacteria bacterium]|nr:hypothetical protein [Actinomycetota bacterium]